MQKLSAAVAAAKKLSKNGKILWINIFIPIVLKKQNFFLNLNF